MGEHRHAERFARFVHVRHLLAQVGRHRRPVRLVVGGELVYSTDDENAALDKLQDLALDYYESGYPDPSTISLVRHGETESLPDWESIH